MANLVIKDWTWDELPSTKDEIWNSLLYTIFLGETVRSAQASYARNVFGSFMDFKKSRSVSDPKWSQKAIALIKAEESNVIATPGEGYKQAMLKILEMKISNLDVSRTIDTALKFFD